MFALARALESMAFWDGGLFPRSPRSRSLSLLLDETVVSALPLAPVDLLREWPLAAWPFCVYIMEDSCEIMSGARGGGPGWFA